MARRRNKGQVLNGWLVMHKPVGITSAHAVAKVKRITNAAKVGHGGTLDPFSEGLLPMALGEATKMLSLVLEGDKSYRCWIRFGAETDTGDPTGQVTEQTEIIPDQASIEAALKQFLGPQEQIPPAYSAVHVNGVRSYELARRGEAVELPARHIVLHHLHLEAYADGLAQVSVTCSKGAYMRSLARDLGRHMGSLAHLEQLLRTETLGFSMKDGITLEQLAQTVASGRLEETLLPVDRVLDDIPALRLRLEDWHKIVNGQAVLVDAGTLASLQTEGPNANNTPVKGVDERGSKRSEVMCRLMTPEERFFGVGVLTEQSGSASRWLCHPKKLFRV